MYTFVWLSGRDKNTKNENPHNQIYIKDAKQSIQITNRHFSLHQIRYFPLLCPIFFFPLHITILHSIFPSPTFIPFWPSFWKLQASKAPPTAFSLTESHSRHLIFLLPQLWAEETETSVLLPSAVLSSSSVVTKHSLVCSGSCKRTKGSHSLPAIEHLKAFSFQAKHMEIFLA